MTGKILIKCDLVVRTGLHIGDSSSFSAIGTVDSTVIRDPFTGLPIVPGSSLKGKLRTLLARRSCVNGETLPDFSADGEVILRMFGGSEPVRFARVLIDGGERTEGDTLLADFQQYGISKLDYVIASHPHTDHIGGLTVFLGMDPADSGVTVGTVITADVPDADIPTTKTYEQFLDNAEAHAEDVCFLSESMELDLGSATLQLIPSPIKSDAETLNEYSICGLLTSGANTFFFTGDAGKQEEQALLAENLLPSQPVDVLKVGHHGSKGSSSTEFLQALHPTDAVISCGTGNSYGHPHQGALERLQEVGCTIYRTDLDGTICIRSDGKALTIQTEAEAS